MSGKVCKRDVSTLLPKGCFSSLKALKKCRADKAIRIPKPKLPKSPFKMKPRDMFAYWNSRLQFSRRNPFQYNVKGQLSFRSVGATKPEDIKGLKLYKTPLDGPLETLKTKSHHKEAYDFLSKHQNHKLVQDNFGYILGLVKKFNKASSNLTIVTSDGRKLTLKGTKEYSAAKARLDSAVSALQKVIPDYDAMQKDMISFFLLGRSMGNAVHERRNPFMNLLFVHFQQPGRSGKMKSRVLGRHKHNIDKLIKVPLKYWTDKHVTKLTAELKVARQRFGNIYRYYKHKVDFINTYEQLNKLEPGWKEARAQVLARYKDEGKMDLLAAIHLGEELLQTGYQYGPRSDKNKKGTYYVDLMYGMAALAELSFSNKYKSAIDQFYNDIVEAHQGTEAQKAQNKAQVAQKAWGEDYTTINDLQQKLLAIKSGKVSSREALKTLKALEAFVLKRSVSNPIAGVKLTNAQLSNSSSACILFPASIPSIRAEGLNNAIKAVTSLRKAYQSHMLRGIEKNFKKAKKLPEHIFWDGMRTRVAKRLKEARSAKDGASFLTAYKDASFLTSIGAQMYVLHTMQKNGKLLAREADSQDAWRTAYSFGLARMPGLDKKKFDSSLDVHKALSNLREVATIFYWGVNSGNKRRFQELTLNAVHDITKAAASFGKFAKHVKKFKWVSWARDIGILVYTLALTEVAAVAAGPALLAGGTRIFFSARSIAALSKIGLQGERAMKAAQLMVRGTRFMGTSAIGAGLITASQIPAQLRAGQKLNVTRNFFRHFLTFAIAGPIVGIATRLLKLSSASGFLTEKFFKWVKGGKTTATEASAFARSAAAVAQKYGVDDKWVQILLKGGKGKAAAWGITAAMASYKILGSLSTEVAAYFAASRASHALLGGHKETLLQQLQGLLMFKALHTGVSPAFSKMRQESLQANIKKINDQVRRLEASGTAKPSELMKLSQQGLLLIVEYRALKFKPGAKTEPYKGVASNLLKTYANAASGIAGRGLPAVLIAVFSFANKNDSSIARDFTSKCGKLSKTDKAAVEKGFNELSNDPVHARTEINRVLGAKGFKLDHNLQLRRVGDNTDYNAATSSTTPATTPSGWSRPMKVLRDVLAHLGESLRIAFFPRTPRERMLAQRGAVNIGGKNKAKSEGKVSDKQASEKGSKVVKPDPARDNRPPEKGVLRETNKVDHPEAIRQAIADGTRTKRYTDHEATLAETVSGKFHAEATTTLIAKDAAGVKALTKQITGSETGTLPPGYKIITKAEHFARIAVDNLVVSARKGRSRAYSKENSQKISKFAEEMVAYVAGRTDAKPIAPVGLKDRKVVKKLVELRDKPATEGSSKGLTQREWIAKKFPKRVRSEQDAKGTAKGHRKANSGNPLADKIAAKAEKLQRERKNKPISFEEKVNTFKHLRVRGGLFHDTSIPHLLKGQKPSKPDTVIVVRNAKDKHELMKKLTGSTNPDSLPKGWVVRTQAEQYAHAQVARAVEKSVAIEPKSGRPEINYSKWARALGRYTDQIIAYQTKRYEGRATGPRPTIDKRSPKDARLLKGIQDHPIMQNLQGVLTKPLPKQLPGKMPPPATKGHRTKVQAPPPAAASRSGNSAVALLRKVINRQEVFLKQDAFKQLPETAKQVKRDQLAADKQKLKELLASEASSGSSPAPANTGVNSKIRNLRNQVSQEEVYQKSDRFRSLPTELKEIKRASLARDKKRLKELEASVADTKISNRPASESKETNPEISIPKARAPEHNRPAGSDGSPAVAASKPSVPTPAHTPTPSGQGKPESVAKKMVDGALRAVKALDKNPGLKSILIIGISILAAFAGVPVALGMVMPVSNRRVMIRRKGQENGTYIVEGQNSGLGHAPNGRGNRANLFIDSVTGQLNVQCALGNITIVRANGNRRILRRGESRALSENDRIIDGSKEYVVGRVETPAPRTTQATNPAHNRVAGTETTTWSPHHHEYPTQIVVKTASNNQRTTISEGTLTDSSGYYKVSFKRDGNGMWKMKVETQIAYIEVGGHWIPLGAGQDVSVTNGSRIKFGTETATVKFPMKNKPLSQVPNPHDVATPPPPSAPTPAGASTPVWTPPNRSGGPSGTTPPMPSSSTPYTPRTGTQAGRPVRAWTPTTRQRTGTQVGYALPNFGKPYGLVNNFYINGVKNAAVAGMINGRNMCMRKVRPGRVIVDGKEVKLTTPRPQTELPKTLTLSKSNPSEITIRDKRGSTHLSTIPGTDMTIRIKTVDGQKHYYVTNNGTSTVQVKNASGKYVNVPQGREFLVTNDNYIRISEGRSRQFVKIKIEQ